MTSKTSTVLFTCIWFRFCVYSGSLGIRDQASYIYIAYMFKLINKNTTLKRSVFSQLTLFGIVQTLLFIFLLHVYGNKPKIDKLLIIQKKIVFYR